MSISPDSMPLTARRLRPTPPGNGWTPHVQGAATRLGTAFPFVVDDDHRIWRADDDEYRPTVCLIDKQGRLRFVVDDDHRIWRADDDEYRPTVCLIDKQGRLRYTHIGRGDGTTPDDPAAAAEPRRSGSRCSINRR